MAQELTALVDVDFLPESYRQRSMHRRAYAWRVVAAASIVGFFAATSLWQHRQYVNVQSKLQGVEAEFVEAAGENASLAQLTVRLQAERKQAELLTYLRHRWPRTQILTAIVEPLPQTVVLSEVHLGQETVQSSPRPAIAMPEAKTVPTSESARRANDLAQLLYEGAKQQHYVTLRGRADDAATLHAYLALLGTNPLFAQVDLQSLEHLTKEGDDPSAIGPMRFTVRVLLCPGHGETVPQASPQPESPTPQAPMARRGG